MKEFLLVRHAKSSWSDLGLEDKLRPLNPRGLKDAPYMAKHCQSMGLSLSHLISSPAVRAFSTAKFFQKIYGKKNISLEKETDLYFGSIEEWLYIINELDDKSCSFPAFFSHNPNITYMTNKFMGSHVENVPTCGVIYLKSESSTWTNVDYDNTRIHGVYFPKALRHGKLY